MIQNYMNFSQPKQEAVKYSPIVLQKQRTEPIKPVQDSVKNVFFRHSANAGDLIYSLLAIRQATRITGKRAVIYQLLNEPCEYWGADHPIGNIMFNEYMFNLCKPLIEQQLYVERLEVWDCHQVQFNIDMIREPEISKELGLPFGDIRQWIMMYYPELQACIGEPWLTTGNDISQKDYIVVNRTARYNNYKIKYTSLQDYNVPIVFLGVRDEYKEFQKAVPRAEFYKTNDFLEVAKIIQGSQLFIGNQSSCFAIAEGLGAPRILEVCPEAPNVIPATPNGGLFRDQKGFDCLLQIKLSK